MLRLSSKILIFELDTDLVKFEIPICKDLEIRKDRGTFTDTAKVTFPNQLRNNSGALDQLNIGDKIEIYLGYYPDLKLEFTGFINFVGRDSPMVLECEDRSFLLKRIALPATNFKNTTIAEVISAFYDGPTQILDTELGDVRINENATVIKILDLLKSKYGILSYFRDEVLFINQDLLDQEQAGIVNLLQQENVPEAGDRLKFQKNTDLAVISHGVSVQRNGTKLELYAYYLDNIINTEIFVTDIKPPGSLNTIKVPNLSLESLEILIKRRLPQLIYTGVTGSVKTYGAPSIEHGDTVNYSDLRTPQKNGSYRVQAVTKTFGVSSGYKQDVKLGLKVAQ